MGMSRGVGTSFWAVVARRIRVAGHDDGFAAEHPAHGLLHAEFRGDALEGEHHVGAVVELGVHGAGAEAQT